MTSDPITESIHCETITAASSPLVRAKEKKQAERNHQNNKRNPGKCSQKAKFTKEEDLSLKELMKSGCNSEEAARAFLEKFSGRTKPFLRRHWGKIQPLPQRL